MTLPVAAQKELMPLRNDTVVLFAGVEFMFYTVTLVCVCVLVTYSCARVLVVC